LLFSIDKKKKNTLSFDCKKKMGYQKKIPIKGLPLSILLKLYVEVVARKKHPPPKQFAPLAQPIVFQKKRMRF
jgi:hypothetical protein